ncbi:MAG: hypothetical protein FWE72_01540 [Spirochaetaceae bacterium]|nr:hypothetical protein [Spirochaetaceae bacterium]
MKKIIKDISELDNVKFGFDLKKSMATLTDDMIDKFMIDSGFQPLPQYRTLVNDAIFSMARLAREDISQIPKEIYRKVPDFTGNIWSCDAQYPVDLRKANILLCELDVSNGDRYGFMFIRANDAKAEGEGLSQGQPFHFKALQYYNSKDIKETNTCFVKKNFRHEELENAGKIVDKWWIDANMIIVELGLEEESFKSFQDMAISISGLK